MLPPETCWQAVLDRDRQRDGSFVYGVSTTGIYCRPSCPSRRPRRENVRFFATPAEAEAAGLRACRRCHPQQVATAATTTDPQHHRMLELAAGLREQVALGEPLRLRDLAARAGLSEGHLQRAFKRALGVSPREYVEACRLELLRSELRRDGDVTRAIYEAGFGSSSRVYEKVPERLGMTPGAYRTGGAGLDIRYTTLPTPLGLLALGATERGICFVHFGDSEPELVARLRGEFPRAAISPGVRTDQATADDPHRGELARWAELLAGELGKGAGGRDLDLPLDLRGTVFEQRVWNLLRAIPRGQTRSYAEIAAALGQPRSSRAVARACAANRTAVLVPCHRVIRADGDLAGYRWGVDRKRHLLAAEGALASARAASPPAEPPAAARRRPARAGQRA
jgi:AraC family transcriptional regulator of adaptative response/methylated-DNA-[protein]-cysteine methyltransferase